MWRSTGKKTCIEKVLWLFLWKLATFHNITRLCMSPLTPLLAWRLAVASLPKHDIHPGCLRNTGLNTFPANAAVRQFWNLASQDKPFWCRRSKDWKRSKELETGKTKAQEDLAWVGKEKMTKSWLGVVERWHENYRSRVSATMGDKKLLSSSSEVEARTGWVRRRWEAQREGGQTKGRSGRSKRAESGLLEGEGRIFIAFQSLGVLRSYYTCQYI